MPESAVHAQAGAEFAHILVSTILNTLYIPGTSRVESRLRSFVTSCMYFQWNMTDSEGHLMETVRKAPTLLSLFLRLKEKDFSSEKPVSLILANSQGVAS